VKQKISIITIVYNNKECIAECIKSILKQKNSNLEYIVIDGGSTDGTLEAIEPYKSELACYISEKDSGLYNALNKGIRNATGDIIGILHSDDLLYADTTLSEICTTFESTNADLVYAKGVYVAKNNANKIRRLYASSGFNKNRLYFGWIPLHTTIYVRRAVFEQYGLYDESFKIASDYEISLRWFTNEKIKKVYLNRIVVKMRFGGKSTTPGLQGLKSSEDYRIIKQYKLWGFITLGCKIARKIPQYIQPLFGLYRT